MKKPNAIVTILICLIVATGSCSRQAGDPLVGVWRSNRPLTEKALEPTLKDGPREAAEKFLAVFGRMTVTYTSNTLIAVMPEFRDYPESTQIFRYQIISQTDDSITAEVEDTVSGKKRLVKATFVSPNRYWIPLEVKLPGIDTSGWREYFDRVK